MSPAETRILQPDETTTVFVSVRIPTLAATGRTSIVTVIATSAVSSIARDASVLAATVEHSPAGLTSDGCYPSSIARVRTGPQSREVALDATGDRAFVAHANGVSAIGMDSLAIIADIPLSVPVPDAGQSNSASLSPTSELRLANYSPAQGIAYDPDNDRIWVSLLEANQLVVLDGTTYATLATLQTADMPYDVAHNPANHRVYVSNYESGQVGVYDADTMQLERTLTDFSRPSHIAVNAVTNKIYVANHSLHGQVTVIDGATHETHRLYTHLFDAYGVTVDTTHNLIYAASVAEGRLSVIDGASEQVLGFLHIRRYIDKEAVWLYAIAVNPDVGPGESHLMLVAKDEKQEVGQLLVIPMTSNGWPPLSNEPTALDISPYPQQGILVDPTTDRVWATSVESGLVNVVQDGLSACPAGVRLYVDTSNQP